MNRCLRKTYVTLKSQYLRVTEHLPPVTAGTLDLLRPGLRAGFGGALNGQERRCEIVRELARSISFDRVVETGTYHGTSTRFLSGVVGAPIDTVEKNPRLFGYSRARLAMRSNVNVVLGDSRAFLRKVAGRPEAGEETVLFYLDAHWEKDLPLADELRIIARTWERAVVIIDDFQVPGDPGYGHDDFGDGRALTEDYLPAEELIGWQLAWPRASSEVETGEKRGSAVLASPKVAPSVAGLRELRPGRTF